MKFTDRSLDSIEIWCSSFYFADYLNASRYKFFILVYFMMVFFNYRRLGIRKGNIQFSSTYLRTFMISRDKVYYWHELTKYSLKWCIVMFWWSMLGLPYWEAVWSLYRQNQKTRHSSTFRIFLGQMCCVECDMCLCSGL